MIKAYRVRFASWFMPWLCLVAMDVLAETVKVDVYYPQTSSNGQVLRLTGSVEAYQHADLASLQSGLVEKLYVDVGDWVKKGQPMLALDAKLARLALAEAQASLDAAEVAHVEAQRLYDEVIALSKQQVVAQTLIAERRAALAGAHAELAKQQASQALQQELVSRHILYAPFEGVVAGRQADLGEWVTPQDSVFTLVEQARLRLNVAIPQEYYAQVVSQPNLQVRVMPDVANSPAFQAGLSRLVAVTDSNSRTLSAYIDLPSDKALLAGMSASAEITLPSEDGVLVWLPRTAVKLHPDGGNSVFAVIDNKAKRLFVDVIDRQDDLVAVSNASANQAYVTSGVELLKEGQTLQIVNVEGQQP